MRKPIVTLTTDFGLRDPYVAEMKAVILSINSDATIVDVSHDVEKFNVRMGAYILACAAPYFPKGTIHVAVVDPSVGTERRAIVIETKRFFFVGPNNGVLALAAEKQEIKNVYQITNQKLMLSKVSATFHGRDIFAPAAAHLAKGTAPEEFGSRISRIVTPSFAKNVKKGNVVAGEVLYVDDFGNVVTSFSGRELELVGAKEAVCIRFKGNELKLDIRKAYADAENQKPFALIGSHGFLEIAMNQASAAERLKAAIGDSILLHLV
ncbi:MAG TPA: S-adenosyl-l-methionine hydroxide adenosyltransferase family protein [Candidatus Acidoferrum sp.]|nr:S-adenosyl-l-methionine hydroxide adenosyltransferase family protein [Candidatus Acidoferrum sp.]